VHDVAEIKQMAIAVVRQVHPPSGKAGHARPLPTALLVVCSLALAALIGAFPSVAGMGMSPLPTPAAEPGAIEVGTLAVQVQTVTWISANDPRGSMDSGVGHEFGTNQDMPAQGMHRLYLQALVSNFGRDSASLAPSDLPIQSPDGRTWQLRQPATLAAGLLEPGERHSIDLFVDVPAAVALRQLRWSHGAHGQSIPIY
jgi:hypothetical protein